MTFIIMLSCLFACSNASTEEVEQAKKALEFDAELQNKQLAGKFLNNATKCLSVVFDGENMVCTYEIDEDFVTITTLTEHKKEQEQQFKNVLMGDPACKSTITNLKTINGKIIYNIIGSYSNKTLTIAFTAEDLQE